MKKLNLILVCAIGVVIVLGWVYFFKKEDSISISKNEDGTLQAAGFVKGERLNLTLNEDAFSGTTGTVYHYGPNDTIPLTHYNELGLKRSGSYRVNHKNGMKAIEGMYKDGKMIGKWTYYDESGKKIKQMEYIDGVLK
ncbi:MAG TPA: hypothetical protein EYG11_08125 [Candidatus Latescibacteria bacterium]|nr:hypothetical protein [Candidatus Handelsmanbacteria bacterium]HIL08652.1 hypothetical protein [Candidatus Latescibacterota bacterium]